MVTKEQAEQEVNDFFNDIGYGYLIDEYPEESVNKVMNIYKELIK